MVGVIFVCLFVFFGPPNILKIAEIYHLESFKLSTLAGSKRLTRKKISCSHVKSKILNIETD